MNPIPSGEGTPQNHTPKTVSEGTWPISLSLYVCMYIYMFYIWAHYGTLLYTPKSNGLNILFRIENAKHWANPPPFRTQKESISSWVVIYIYIPLYPTTSIIYIYICTSIYIYISHNIPLRHHCWLRIILMISPLLG